MTTAFFIALIIGTIFVSPCNASLIVTVGPNTTYDYQDLQTAIDSVLCEQIETEAIIKLEGGVYQRLTGFKIDIGNSNIHKLSLQPINDMAVVTFLQHEGCGSYLNVLWIEGNADEDKEFHIEGIKFDPAIYYDSVGIYINRGFRKVSIRNCSFTDVSSSIVIDLNRWHGGIHELEIVDNTFECNVGSDASQQVAFIKYESAMLHTQPDVFAFHISGNEFWGRISDHIVITFDSVVPELVIENNSFYSELYNLQGEPCAFHADVELISPNNYLIDEGSYTKPVIRNNNFINSSIDISNISAEILNNSFRETFDNYNQNQIMLRNGQYYFSNVDDNRLVNIRENVFRGDLYSAILLLPYYDESALSIMRARVIDNTFISCDHGLEIYTNQSLIDGADIVPVFANNLLIDHANPISVFEDGTEIQLQLDPPIDGFNNFFEEDPSTYAPQNLDLVDCGYGDPFIDLGLLCDYSLIWDETTKSPLINAGCPVIDGVIQTDPDGTPPDIGARYYPHHHQEYFDTVSESNIYWLSFPVVDDKSNTNGTYWNELGYMFESHMQDAPDSQLDEVHWSYDGHDPTMEYIQQSDIWMNSNVRAYQPIGYKVKFNPGEHPDPMLVNGFKADPVTTSVSWTVEYLHNGQMQDFPNLIGYFLPATHRAGDALSRNIPGSSRFSYLDYVHTIKTRNWGTCRLSDELNSPWLIDPNTYTLSEGDMVELLLISGAPEEMYWNSNLPSTPPIVRPRSTAFDFEEQLDYSSLFIEFDPEDIPREVGVFIDGVCRGASVVDSTIVDICVYPDAAKSSSEPSIVFYYEGKGAKAAKGWKTYNPESMIFEDRVLNLDEAQRYAYISFNRKAGDSPQPLATSLLPNYPNPFNPNTNISFVLGADMPVTLDIYNIKGQKVRTLCDEYLAKGKHSLMWDGRDSNCVKVASGIYFYRLCTPDGIQNHKMMLMK